MMTRPLPTLNDMKDVRGKRVIVRASLDVPIQDGVVQNYFRVMRAIPTMLNLVNAGARVIILTHIGRDPKTTLAPLAPILNEHVPTTFIPHLLGREVEQAIESLQNGSVLLLENLRSHVEEETNDEGFARKLASYGDYYVNDAFAVSHRAHASIVGIPKYLPHFAGFTFAEEYNQLQKVLKPEAPSLFILGGAKFETKQPLIEQYAEAYTNVFVGGALANDLFKGKGYEVGKSLLSPVDLSESPLLLKKNILIPTDVTTLRGDTRRVTDSTTVEKDENIRDAGPKTMKMLAPLIKKAKTILWNGPFGDYEHGFDTYTKECAKLIAESEAYSVVGGGDTVAAIESLALNEKFGFLSTAGGAMLCFLEDGTLPGIEALLQEKTK